MRKTGVVYLRLDRWKKGRGRSVPPHICVQEI